MIKQSAREYIQSYMPDIEPLETGVVNIPKEIYEKITHFGELTFGNQKQVSIFTAIKKLAKKHANINALLQMNATSIGKEINDTLINHIDDPWFDTILLYRPDMLISKQHHVYTNELEIVVGGSCPISLLQHYIYGKHILINGLLDNMHECQAHFQLQGKIAFLADRNGTVENSRFHWLSKKIDSDVIVAFTDELDFKSDGVYFNNNKIALAHIFIKAHKYPNNINKNDIQLLHYWLQKKIILTSPPSSIIDNKLILFLLQHHEYKSELQQILGRSRYKKINDYLPKTFYLNSMQGIQNLYLQSIVHAPWMHGKFIVKHATLWGSKNIIFSPESEKDRVMWKKQLYAMLNNVNSYGPLLIQEAIDVLNMPLIKNTKKILGKTKFIPFFVYQPMTKRTTQLGMGVNISPTFTAHLDSDSQYGLVESI